MFFFFTLLFWSSCLHDASVSHFMTSRVVYALEIHYFRNLNDWEVSLFQKLKLK